MEQKFFFNKTKKNFPALWERGGGMTNTGEARIITSPDGLPLKPIYINQRGHLSCGEHALFIIKKGDLIIEADHHRGDFEIKIYKIQDIGDCLEGTAILINSNSYGEWDHEIDVHSPLRAAIDAAQDKALCYHCREPHYFISHE